MRELEGWRLEIALEEPAAGRPSARTGAFTQVDARLEAPGVRLESLKFAPMATCPQGFMGLRYPAALTAFCLGGATVDHARQILSSRYHLLTKLGEESTASVYQAEDQVRGCLVASKSRKLRTSTSRYRPSDNVLDTMASQQA